MSPIDLEYEAQRSLRRLRPGIDSLIESHSAPDQRAELQEIIDHRLRENWPEFFRLLHRLYGGHYDFFYYLESILLTAVRAWIERPPELKELDQRRENNRQWYLSERMIGGSLYVDLFAGDLVRLKDKIPYLQRLGLTYLHLMPLFNSPKGNSDGGYAISDYRSVDPKFGTLGDLRNLATALREANISLVLDFVFNHTSDEHEWAVRARENEREYQDYYFCFPDRRIPDQYESNLREIFPSIRRGNFTWHHGMGRWVWTTFNSFQWDLNYSNPEVFRAMAGEMLHIANTGVEILRLDAVAFIWKRIGTNCENLEEAHLLIQTYNALCRIAAPSLVFKSEAIVHPDEVVKYISQKECQLSYNPTLMALLWESIATRETKLLRQSLRHRIQLPEATTWLNYLRSHDDIGWSFDNGDALQVGIHPDHHRDFLNRFYSARFEGSFARGVPFQHNLDTGDMRISGTTASLAGLEQALELNDNRLIQMAVSRIRMLYGVLCSVTGIPLIFLGEELGLCNDYSYLENPDKAEDSRWIHRVPMDWNDLDGQLDPGTVKGHLFRILQHFFEVRKTLPAFGSNEMQLLPIDHPNILAYLRRSEGSTVVVIANFSEKWINLDVRHLRSMALSFFMNDQLSGQSFSTSGIWNIQPYDVYWLTED